jgi:hypothetical protein
MLATLPGKGPTFNTDYLPTFLNIIVDFRWGLALVRVLSWGVSRDAGCRRKHGMPLVADDKAKAPKKKNLQVAAL